MIFLRCLIRGFGRFDHFALDFQPGLNVVFAPNEGGKSTLQRFLLSMLYGPLRSEVKNQRRLEPWVDHFRPWRGADYGGILWCGMSDGTELEVHRSLSRDDIRVEIRTASGEDITGRYEQQRNGDVLFARAHLGMPKELFEAVAVIRENRAGELGGHDSIRERIANLAQTGDEELSVRLSLQKLEAAAEQIGSERAPTRPYRQTAERVAALQEERLILAARRAEFEAWVEDRNRLAARVVALENEHRQAARVALRARRMEAAVRVRALEDLDSEVRALDAQIEQTGGDPNFPAQHLEELDQLTGARDSLERRLAELRQECSTADHQVAALRGLRAQLAEYEALNSSAEADKVTEWFVGYMSASLQKEGAQRSAAQLGEEIRSLDESAAALGQAAADPEIDWETKARQASEQEGECSRQILAIAGQLSACRARTAEARRQRARRSAAATMALLLGCISFALAFFYAPAAAFGAVGLAGLAASAVCFSMAAKTRKSALDAEFAGSKLEGEQATLQEMTREAKSGVLQAMESGGFGSLDDFLAASRKGHRLREKAGHLKVRLAEAEQHREEAAQEVNDLYAKLKRTLTGVHLGCSPATLRAQVDLLRTNLRRFRELDGQFKACQQRHSALLFEQSELVRHSAEKQSAIGRIMAHAGVPTPEAYRERCRARQRAIELLEKKSSRAREFQRLCHPLTLDQWRARLAEIEAEAGTGVSEVETPESAAVEGAEPHAPQLPYLPSVEEAEAEEKRAAAELAGVRQECAVSVERVGHAFRGYRTVSEIEEDLAAAQREFLELDANRRALALASGTLRELSRQQQENLAPQLNRAVEGRFVRLCSDRYAEVKIDPDFQVHVRESATGELRKLESLSRGTQDQLYFAMRFGVLDLVSKPDEPSPCLLDEPFAAYDGSRLAEAMRILVEEAAGRQLLLFTCREDLHALAARSGASLFLSHMGGVDPLPPQ